MLEFYFIEAFYNKNQHFFISTTCGKISFVQGLGKNKMFGDGLKSIDWVSKINLTKTKEEEIKECFNYKTIEFHYLDDLDDFDSLLETFKKNYKQVTDRKQMAIVTFLVRKKN